MELETPRMLVDRAVLGRRERETAPDADACVILWALPLPFVRMVGKSVQSNTP